MKKQLRRTLATAITLALFTLALAGTSWAGKGNGAMDGTGPQTDIVVDVTFWVKGYVEAIGTPTAPAYKIDTGAEEPVAVYGFGPTSYWDSLNVARPEEGEYVEILAFDMTFTDGTVETIALTVTVFDADGIPTTVTLRDLETGVPLWR